MRGKWFAAGILAAAGVLAWTAPSRAGDTVLLNGNGNTPAQQLVDDGRGADTITVHHGGFGRGFGYGGFGRGFGYGGFGRGFGYGGYGRGFGYGGFGRGFGYGYGGFGRGLGFGYGGYGRGFGYGGFGRGFGYGYRGYGLGLGYGLLGLGYGLGYGGYGLGYGGYGLGYGGYGYGGYYPGFGIGYGGYGGYYPSYGYGGYYGCSGLSGGVYTLSTVTSSPQPSYTDLAPPQAPRTDGTYPYDGGPQTPVPNPQAAPTPPTGTQPRTVPFEGRAVSLPKPATKWTYPAYGESARRTLRPQDHTLLTKGEPKGSNAH